MGHTINTLFESLCPIWRSFGVLHFSASTFSASASSPVSPTPTRLWPPSLLRSQHLLTIYERRESSRVKFHGIPGQCLGGRLLKLYSFPPTEFCACRVRAEIQMPLPRNQPLGSVTYPTSASARKLFFATRLASGPHTTTVASGIRTFSTAHDPTPLSVACNRVHLIIKIHPWADV